MIEIGKKVVCIDDKPNNKFDHLFGLKEGEIYPVSSVFTCTCGIVGIAVGIKCNIASTEICDQCNRFVRNVNPGDDVFFASRRFRPIDYDFAESVIQSLIEEPAYV
jgi:hypothetical protein